MWQIIEAGIEAVKAEFRGRPNLRQVYARVSADQTEPGLAGETFEPGKSYFSVRLIEHRLATAGRYLVEFLPMCTCFLSFRQGQQKRTVPFIAGPDMIRGLVGPNAAPDAAKRITFANLAVASNVPVPGGDVTMYLSLCRFKDSGLVRGLLDLAAKTATAVAGPTAGPLVKTATDFAGGLMDIVKADGVETRFARLEGDTVKVSGYRLLAGSADPIFQAQDIFIRDGQLLRRTPRGDTTIDDTDYLVVAFEHRSTLKDETFSLVEELPFHSHWLAATDAIARGKGAPDAADGSMMELRSAVLLSPDLTETDRLPLLQLYDTKREQMEQQFKPRFMAGSDSGLLNALYKRVNIEKQAGSDLAPLLGAASAAVSDVVATPRTFAPDTTPSGAELAATFDALLDGQRKHFADATVAQLAAAARAYSAAAARR